MMLNKKVFALIIVTSLLTGCSKSVLNEKAPHIILADNLFVDKGGFESGLNALYDEVRRARSGTTYGSAGPLMLTPAFIGVDNAYANWGSPTEDIFNNWGAYNNAGQSMYREIWAWLYETINVANTIISRSNNQEIDWTDAEKNQILGEAKCIRAWCYRHLTYLWGDVPMTLEESTGTNIKSDWQRIPVAEVRKAMEEDWLFAEKHLPETPARQGKVCRGVAQHYLAELYLAMGQPGKARDEALKVVQNSNYKLVTNRYGVNKDRPGTPFTDMFIDGNSNREEGNTEALWVLQSELNVIGGEGSNIMRRYWVNRYYSLRVGGKNPVSVSLENGGRGIGRWGHTKWALSIYDASDNRGSEFAWRLYYLINNPSGIPAGMKLGDTIYLNRTLNEKLTNPDWPHIRKWDYASPINVNVDRQYNDQIFLRSGETWLLLAEANFKLGDMASAAEAINVLRTRAKAPAVNASQITLDYILDERSRELFSEEERRYTLLRTKKWLERTRLYNVLAGSKITARDTVLPIPQDVIDANRPTPMPQNPGY